MMIPIDNRKAATLGNAVNAIPNALPPAPFGYPIRKLTRPILNSKIETETKGIAGAPHRIRSADSVTDAITNCSSVF